MDARAKLKRLVDADNIQFGYSPTYAQATRAYNIINYCVFDGALKKPTIIIRTMNLAWGICEGDLYTGADRFIHDPVCHRIVLNTSFPSRKFFVEVLAHEMIHQYQCEHLNRMDHGRTFWEWKPKFERYNLKLFIEKTAKSASR
jgi:hypothetical protein